MSTLPGPLRAVLGVVATVLDEARALPEKAPDLSMTALTTALQYSLRAQQRYAELMVRGDELVGRIRGVPDEAPAWAKFDDDTTTDSDAASSPAAAGSTDFAPPPTPPAKAPPASAPAKRAVKKVSAKKVPAKKVSAKKVPAKKVSAKKVPAKRTSPAIRSGPRLSAFDRVDESAIDDGLVPPTD
jgi:hypothetical protein